MKQKLTPRWLIIKLTGLLFALYSAYNIFIIIRDIRSLTFEGKLISALVALLFALLALYALTSEIKDILFRMIRKWMMTFVLLAIFALKMRMVNKVIDFIVDYFSYSKPISLLYGGAYFLTQAALLILVVYYYFFRRMIPNHPKVAIILPLSAMILFLFSFVFEMILFLRYGIITEASPLRTAVSRPLFYLGFIGLSAYFLYPPQLPNKK